MTQKDAHQQDKKKCEPKLIEGQWACAKCAKLRLPCTWHHTPELLSRGWQDLLLKGKTFVIRTIPGPSLAAAVTKAEIPIDEGAEADSEDDSGDSDDE